MSVANNERASSRPCIFFVRTCVRLVCACVHVTYFCRCRSSFSFSCAAAQGTNTFDRYEMRIYKRVIDFDTSVETIRTLVRPCVLTPQCATCLPLRHGFSFPSRAALHAFFHS